MLVASGAITNAKPSPVYGELLEEIWKVNEELKVATSFVALLARRILWLYIALPQPDILFAPFVSSMIAPLEIIESPTSENALSCEVKDVNVRLTRSPPLTQACIVSMIMRMTTLIIQISTSRFTISP